MRRATEGCFDGTWEAGTENGFESVMKDLAHSRTRGLFGGYMREVEHCACGEPLHYVDPATERMVRRLIAELGNELRVTTPVGTWLVPRHYIALHGIRAAELPSSKFKRIA